MSETVTTGGGLSVIVTSSVTIHPVASWAVTVYVPAQTPVWF